MITVGHCHSHIVKGKWEGGRKVETMKEGALSVLVILIYSTLYTLKRFAPLPKQRDRLVPGQRKKKGGAEGGKSEELNSFIK